MQTPQNHTHGAVLLGSNTAACGPEAEGRLTLRMLSQLGEVAASLQATATSPLHMG